MPASLPGRYPGDRPAPCGQYLPWVAGNRPARDVEDALDRIERAIGGLPR